MGIKFGPGTMYFADEPYVITSADIIEESDEKIPTPLVNAVWNTVCTFEALAHLSFEAWTIIAGLRDTVLTVCSNKKVVHLARYATKKKVRKKNFRRAIRILEER